MKKIIYITSALMLSSLSSHYAFGANVPDMKKELGIQKAGDSYDARFDKLPADVAISFLNKNFTYKKFHGDKENTILQAKLDEIIKSGRLFKPDGAKEYKAILSKMYKLNQGKTDCVFGKDKLESEFMSFDKEVTWLKSPLPVKYSQVQFNISGQEGAKAVAINSKDTILVDGKHHKSQCVIYLRPTDNDRKVGSALYSLGISYGIKSRRK